MKRAPSPFQSLFRALWLGIAVALWPLWWLVTTWLVELSWIVFVPILLVFAACLIHHFVRQLDEIEGPSARGGASKQRDV